MSTASETDILPCVECSLAFGKAAAPVTYFEDEFRDEDDCVQVNCPGCGTEASAETPEATIAEWNALQTPKLARAREFIESWDAAEPVPPAVRF